MPCFIPGEPILGVCIGSSLYQLPDLGWVGNGFYPFFKGFLNQSLGVNYETSTFDCKNFAAGAAFMAEVCQRQTAGHKVESALAFGWMFLRPGIEWNVPLGAGHAINFFVSSNNNRLELWGLEPQTGVIQSLSKIVLDTIIQGVI